MLFARSNPSPIRCSRTGVRAHLPWRAVPGVCREDRSPRNDIKLEVTMNENIFRILAALIFFTGVGISVYYRRRADKETGEKISRKVDGSVMMTAIKIGGLILWLTPLVYLINPNWMNWSKIGLPESVRWLGVGVGILCVLGIYWLFSSIGSNISPTSATRKEHQARHQRTVSLGAPPALYSWGILVHCVWNDGR